MKTYFKTWERETLERFAREVADENKTLKELVKSLFKAWKEEVIKNENKEMVQPPP